MKATKIFMMAALALTFAACSNDDNDFAQQPAEQSANGEITITATIATDGATTRALSVDGTNIASNYVVGEKIAVLFEYKSAQVQRDAEVTSLSGSTATVQFTIPADLTGTNIAATLVYPSTAVNAAKDGADVAAALATQTGDIATCPEVRTGSGTLNADAKTLTVASALTAQNAIFKFDTQDLTPSGIPVSEFKVSDGSGNVMTTVTPSGTPFYVALPAMAAGTYWFNATFSGKPYIAKATVTTATTAGKFYTTTVKMATIGDVILDNGKFAAPSSTGTKVAMIAYLGNGSNCTNGLAIQLNASPESMNWSAACSYSSYPSITGNPGTWRLPSKADWQNMFVGCAKDGDAISPDGDGKMDPIAGFKEKIGATGITWKSIYYWSNSTGSGSNAWYVLVRLGGPNASANFNEDDTSRPFYVLGCLAF